MPNNITLLPLPPKCPELNVMVNIWQFLRGPKATPEGRYIVDHCCHNWNRLTEQPWRIMSIGLREWAHEF